MTTHGVICIHRKATDEAVMATDEVVMATDEVVMATDEVVMVSTQWPVQRDQLLMTQLLTMGERLMVAVV